MSDLHGRLSGCGASSRSDVGAFVAIPAPAPARQLPGDSAGNNRRPIVSLYNDRIFPHLLRLVSRHFDEDRRRMLAHARGRVLELGVGTGASVDFYPAEVVEVVGIDPSAAMVDRAMERVRRLGRELPFRVRLHQADGESLPYDDASFDTVVAFLTLCTIPDARTAAMEAYRVLRPGGLLLVLEHVRARPGRMLAWWQDRLDPLWTRAAGGCHLNRDTPATLAAAGFDTSGLERYTDQSYFPPASPRVRGVLRKA
jgi:ubiquinone/menaquinone biosynthesis C-methylase UbiE